MKEIFITNRNPFLLFWFIFIRTILCVHKNQIKQSQNKMAFLQNRSVSMVDMYIDNSEPSENVGQIHFSIEYDFQNTNLILKIMQVSNRMFKQLRFHYIMLLIDRSQIRERSCLPKILAGHLIHMSK